MREKNFDLLLVLQGCLKGNRNSQRRLYEQFYGYALSICLRYSKGRDEAVEILNDAFLKVFNHLDKYDTAYPFKVWLRRVLINSAIDYHRKNRNLTLTLDLASAVELAAEEMPLPKLSKEEDVLPILQKLSPAYRVVFNLYVLEGYTHQEIAELLGIDVRTSRSNLSRAIQNLRALMTKKTFDTAKMN
ncbi:MAG: sigma-70 family RNA polymerase sigma factor [Phycisphaerae bacterium]|nr:sigma-70 family RNA polymerase sigma factor [Saprospiraceae bacterium]